MATGIPSYNISTLEQMYIDSCMRHDVQPNTEILSGFFKAEVKKSPAMSYAVWRSTWTILKILMFLRFLMYVQP
ncbi:hypothetical protein OIU78_008422 [Salix suchowensis]|nr:hypothetical protein OIU78_008422 [Salix suchowensis]